MIADHKAAGRDAVPEARIIARSLQGVKGKREEGAVTCSGASHVKPPTRFTVATRAQRLTDGNRVVPFQKRPVARLNSPANRLEGGQQPPLPPTSGPACRAFRGMVTRLSRPIAPTALRALWSGEQSRAPPTTSGFATDTGLPRRPAPTTFPPKSADRAR